MDIFCPGSYLCDVVVDVSLRSCVEMHQVCDGKADCPAGDDETECGMAFVFVFVVVVVLKVEQL